MSTERLEVHWTGADGSVRHTGTPTPLGSAQIQQFSYSSVRLADGFALRAGLPSLPSRLSPPRGASASGSSTTPPGCLGLPRSQVLRVTTGIAQVARGAWDRASRDHGLDPEVAEACRRLIESACDFDTVLDGREPR